MSGGGGRQGVEWGVRMCSRTASVEHHGLWEDSQPLAAARRRFPAYLLWFLNSSTGSGESGVWSVNPGSASEFTACP